MKNRTFRVKRLAIKHAKISRRRKRLLAFRNKIRNRKKKNKYTRKRNNHKFKRHDVIVPPEFSLITNREVVLKFFNDCKSLSDSTYTLVFFDFSNVTDISHGAITILLSICGWLADQNLKIQCNYPHNTTSKLVFEESGFLKFFKTNTHKYQSTENAILQKGQQETESEITAIHIRKAMKTVWGTSQKNVRIQGMLIEMMANAINHAYGKNQRGWYFALQHLPDENKVRFCFVDNGKGIINSLNLKLNSTIVKILGLLDNGNVLINAFDGKFGSSTHLSFRGRGLPLIKRNQELNVIKNLKVICNNVFLDLNTGEFNLLTEPFEGTFYYWELDQTCNYGHQSKNSEGIQ